MTDDDEGWIDIGNEHEIIFYTARDSDTLVGCMIRHYPANDVPGIDTRGKHVGGVFFDLPENKGHINGPVWQLISLEPLHLEPSILCGCGDHGWIREGRWVNG